MKFPNSIEMPLKSIIQRDKYRKKDGKKYKYKIKEE